jgi:hypothetical protein
MTRRALALLFALPALALPQLRLYIVEPGGERPAPLTIDLGTVETGDVVTIALRIKNIGTTPATLETLTVAGSGFTLADPPPLPVTLLAGAAARVHVKFQPSALGQWSARITLNDVVHDLLVRATAGPSLVLEGTGPLASGSTVDFGSVERGSSATLRFVLENRTGQPLAISELAVGGRYFRGPAGAAAPVQLAGGVTVPFAVAFEPGSSTVETGTLRVNQRVFHLRGTGVEPQAPKPRIQLDPQGAGSGRQVRLSVRFDQAARTSGSGRVRLEFSGPEDPAIEFLSPKGRAADFNFVEGDDAGRFGARRELELQTGTTAGTLVFRVELGAYTEQLSLEIPPAPVVIDAARGVRGASSVAVEIAGFDNARSTSELSFIFYDRSGAVLSRGPIRVNLAEQFRSHYANAGGGGLFSVRAVFPVSGNVSLIDAVDVELVNSLGQARKNVRMTE